MRTVNAREARSRASQARDRAMKLARHQPSEALVMARGIRDPWFRAQALAAAGRYAADDEWPSIIKEAFAAAAAAEAEADDPYNTLAVSAWPLRAIVERGQLDTARRELTRLLHKIPRVEPESSRSEALFGLFQAAFPIGSDVRESMARRLIELGESEGAYWRTRRNVVDSLAMFASADHTLAIALARQITDDKTRAKAMRAIDSPSRRAPRGFF